MVVSTVEHPADGGANPPRTVGLESNLANAFFQTCADGLMITDAQGLLVAINPAFTEMTGYTTADALGRKPGDLLGSERTPPDFYREVFATIEEQGWWRGEVTNRLKNGQLAIHAETIARVTDDEGRVTHYVSTLVDITELCEARALAREEHAITNAVLSSLPGIFFLVDQEGRNWRCNGNARQYLGRPSSWCRNPPQDTYQLFDEGWHGPIRHALKRGFAEGQVEMEADINHTDGGRTPFHFSAHRLTVGETDYLCGLGLDMTRHRELEDNLKLLATTDPLTGALNRRAMEERLRDELARCTRYDCSFSLLMVDLDNFKRLNDRFGHDTGDRVLREVVEALQGRLRRNDALARWGGEEFLILLAETSGDNGFEAAERMRQWIQQHVACPEGHPVTLSLGLTAARAGDDMNALLKRADDAMYQAKAAGRNRIHVVQRPNETGPAEQV